MPFGLLMDASASRSKRMMAYTVAGFFPAGGTRPLTPSATESRSGGGRGKEAGAHHGRSLSGGRPASSGVVSCGHTNETLLQNIEAVGVKTEAIELLLITHCYYDHTGGARWLRERFGCTVVMHESDARFLESGDNAVTAASWYGSRLEPCMIDRKLAGSPLKQTRRFSKSFRCDR